MLNVRGRPFGIGFLVATIAADGAGHLVAAYDSLFNNWLDVAVKLLVGCLLLIKARGLWRLNRVTYWAVVIATALGAAVETLEVLGGHAGRATYVALAWSLLTVVYLAHPRIRALFLQHA